MKEGPEEGPLLGSDVGILVGDTLGTNEGTKLGLLEGILVGETLGTDVGATLGLLEGLKEGDTLGAEEGASKTSTSPTDASSSESSIISACNTRLFALIPPESES